MKVRTKRAETGFLLFLFHKLMSMLLFVAPAGSSSVPNRRLVVVVI
jgi:hypothetical protein